MELLLKPLDAITAIESQKLSDENTFFL